MNKIKEFFTDWSWKEKAWLAFVLIVQTVAWAIQKESLFMLVMTLTSSLNLVLGAKGKVAGLYFAIINSALYAINCMGIPLYGEVMYNLIYSIPVSAIAIFTWKKNMTKGGEVKFRTMTPNKDYAHNSSSDNYRSTWIHADSEMDGWKSSIYGFSDNSRIGCGKFPVSASFLRAVGNVGNCKCTFNCDVDHGIYAGRFLCTADYHYEDNQLHQLHIRFPELEKNCKRNCIITDKNRGFYVKIIKDQEGHGFHVSMRSVAFCVNDKPKLFFMANRWKVR